MGFRPLAVVVLATMWACGGATVNPGENGRGSDDGGSDVSQAEAAPPPVSADGGECNALVNDAPITHYTCPGVCTQCTPPAQGGGAIQEGTYVLLGGDAYFSACGILEAEDTRAKLVVHGGTIEYVYTGPISFAENGSYRETYTFAIAGSQITVKRTCPPPDGPIAPAGYVASGDILAIPVGPWAAPPYYKRQP